MVKKIETNTPRTHDKYFPELTKAPIAPSISGFDRFGSLGALEGFRGESLPDLRDRLRNEINHGREYLMQVQSELHENRALLEQWAQYEQACSLQPLDHLVQSASLKENVEKFLSGWLKRREKELGRVERRIRSTEEGKNQACRRPTVIE
ncbi:MAG TPA: hypothetical protein VL793_02840 [Patescibacteria group bacterium]|nr:hypothetical protein [Patescibacteria group bacterium]